MSYRGTTDYDLDGYALRQILNVWSGGDIYAARSAAITNAPTASAIISSTRVKPALTVRRAEGPLNHDRDSWRALLGAALQGK